MRLDSPRVRLYESIRTAHLERAHELVPAAIVYRERRYDFDEGIARGLELVQAGPVRAALLLRRSRPEAIEVNEPLMLSSLPATALALFAVRFLRRRSPRVVTYAIGNADPYSAPDPSLKRRVRWLIERRLSRYVWKRIDAIAFGTEGARDVYRALLPRRHDLVESLVPALPARSHVPAADREHCVVFLGAFAPRKGVPLLLAAWPRVRDACPGATLTLLGKGALQDEVDTFAAAQPGVDVMIDPPRDAIRATLRRSLVLVLPSQPSATWREQVGLPIVEALEQGCAVVTTTETGLAPWLEAHGHGVVPGDADAEALARAIIGQIEAGDRSAEILASLPVQDGRLAADEWLFGDAPTVQGDAHG